MRKGTKVRLKITQHKGYIGVVEAVYYKRFISVVLTNYPNRRKLVPSFNAGLFLAKELDRL